jgi:hypothetical protein
VIVIRVPGIPDAGLKLTFGLKGSTVNREHSLTTVSSELPVTAQIW